MKKLSDKCKKDILSLEFNELEDEILRLSEPKFRAKQIFDWLHVKRVSDFGAMTNLSAQFRERISSLFCIKSLFALKRLASEQDNTVKYLYELDDNNRVETVMMEYEHGTSLCISTQVGCKMGCRFCFKSEIVFSSCSRFSVSSLIFCSIVNRWSDNRRIA